MAKVLQLTPIRMENYGNSAVNVLGMFHAFLRWKDKVYNHFTLLTVTDPPTCCQGMLVTYLEFLTLVTLWKIPQIPPSHKQHPVTQKVDIHFFIRK